MIRRLVRVLGTLLIVGGLGLLVWAGLVWQWQDPFTAVVTRLDQRELDAEYDRLVDRISLPPPLPRTAPVADRRAEVARDARTFERTLRRGSPIGRLHVPRMGLDMIVVNGTDPDTLQKGPGRHLATALPGEGHLVYVAGHRTTYGAPFSRIDDLRRGDVVTLELPYATFEYEITGHRIVEDDELSVLRPGSRELLALQACHPRFFASHRWIAYARPVRVTPRGGGTYSLAAAAE